jgi:hypothetical protein
MTIPTRVTGSVLAVILTLALVCEACLRRVLQVLLRRVLDKRRARSDE